MMIEHLKEGDYFLYSYDGTIGKVVKIKKYHKRCVIYKILKYGKNYFLYYHSPLWLEELDLDIETHGRLWYGSNEVCKKLTEDELLAELI